MAKCLHREDQPARKCLGCGAWLSTGNPLDICAQCNGGTWNLEPIPESIWAQLSAAKQNRKGLTADALGELLGVGE